MNWQACTIRPSAEQRVPRVHEVHVTHNALSLYVTTFRLAAPCAGWRPALARQPLPFSCTTQLRCCGSRQAASKPRPCRPGPSDGHVSPPGARRASPRRPHLLAYSEALSQLARPLAPPPRPPSANLPRRTHHRRPCPHSLRPVALGTGGAEVGRRLRRPPSRLLLPTTLHTGSLHTRQA